MSEQTSVIKLDVVIIGGGVAGLFTLAKLINAGYHAVLLEKEALGAGQTLKSQGIIHGGTKYTLLGKQTAAQKQIAKMPDYWRDCLSGRGEFDLRDVSFLTDQQCMWAQANLSSAVTGFFASRVMQSHVKKLEKNDLAKTFQHHDCKGNFYALNEPVLNIKSLLTVLEKRYQKYILTTVSAITIDENKGNTHVTANTATKYFSFCPNRIVFTAGENNTALSNNQAKQQLRPLRMVYAFVPKAFGKVFVHIIAASDKPRLTITTHPGNDDQHIWYLGGNLAEKGAHLSEEETLTLAKRELQTLFPWLDFSSIELVSFLVNRAEGICDNKRPDTPMVQIFGASLVAWPTKLVMAPILADNILKMLPKPTVDNDVLPLFDKPQIANYPWEESE